MRTSNRVLICLVVLAVCCLPVLGACAEESSAEGRPVALAGEPVDKASGASEIAPVAVVSNSVSTKAEKVNKPAPAKPKPPKAAPPKAAPAKQTQLSAKPTGSKGSELKSKDRSPRTWTGVQAEWKQFFTDATTHYKLDEKTSALAQGILDSCLSRGAKAQESLAAAGNPQGSGAVDKKAGKAHERLIKKLTDELVGRIDALATIEQIRLASKGGYESPRTKNLPKPVVVGGPAPAWELKTPEGKLVTMESLRGKVVVLKFWASWCGYCKKAAPEIQKIHEKYKDKPVEVWAVNAGERGVDKKTKPIEFIKKNGYTYNILLEGDMVKQLYGVSGFPTTFVIDANGKIVHKQRGFGAGAAKAIGDAVERALKV